MPHRRNMKDTIREFPDQLNRWIGRTAFEGSLKDSETSTRGAEIMVESGGELAKTRKKAKKKKKK